MQVGEGGGQRADLGTSGAQGRGEGRVLGGGAVLGHRGEDTVGAQLDVGADALRLQGLDRVGEADGLADVAHPVLGGGEVGGLVEGGDDRDGRGTEGQPLHHRAELGEHRLHQRRVERVADRQPLGLAAQLRQLRGDLGHGLLGARDDDGRRAVDGRDAHLVGQQRQDLRLGGLHRDHRATGGQRLHQTRARCHEESGLSQGEGTRTMRGRYLANRVTHQEVRPHTPRLHKTEQRHLDREQRRLGVLRPVDRVIVGGEHHLAQRTVQVLVQVREHLVESIGEHREGLVQLTRPSRPAGCPDR